MIRKHIVWFSLAAAVVNSCKSNPGGAPPGGSSTSAPASASAASPAAAEVHALADHWVDGEAPIITLH